MQKYSDIVQDKSGNARSRVPVRITQNGASALIYADDGVTRKTNPLTTDTSGVFSFKAPDGVYAISVNGVQYATITLLDITDISGPLTSVQVYAETGDTTWFARRYATATLSGAHAGNQSIAENLSVRPVGSGLNGPGSADYGKSISIIKQNYTTSTVEGEIDGLQVVVRQGGTHSDCAGILTNVLHAGTGFSAAMESVTSIYDTGSNTITQQIDTQICVTNNYGGTGYYGFVATKSTGTGGNAYYAQGSAGGNWDFLFKGRDATSDVFTVDYTGLVKTRIATTPPAGGVLFLQTSNAAGGLGLYMGSGAPTVSAAKGSMYLRTDGSATNNRAYINTDGSTTWTAITTTA
jgi:hypothetical protein